MIACDLFAALSVADWPKREWTVLSEILMQVYGPQKRREAHVDPRLVEHYSGLSSKNVYRALKNLKACEVIAENPNGSYRFVKDFESWNYETIEKVTRNPIRSRRLNDGDLRFAASANDRYGVVAFIKKSKGVGIPSDTAGIPLDTKPMHLQYPVGYQTDAPTVSNGILPIGKDEAKTDESNPCDETTSVQALACERVRASEDLESGEKRIETHRGNSGACVSINGSEPIPIEDAPKRVQPSLDLAELVRVQAKAEHLFPGLGYDYQVSSTAVDWPLAWVDAALSDLAASGKKEWHYLRGILKRYHRDGGPNPSVNPPAVSPPVETVETPEQKAARHAKLAAGMKAHLAQMEQEGRRAPRQ